MDNKIIDVLSIVEDQVKKWNEENTEEQLRKQVNEFLDVATKDTILKVLGFEINTHSRQNAHVWKVDHCNGRSGESLIGTYIRDAVREKLNTMIKDYDKLSNEEINDIKREVHKEYLRMYKQTIKQQAEKVAREHAQNFIRNEVETQIKGVAEKMRLTLKESTY